jgi:hypothetical protein
MRIDKQVTDLLEKQHKITLEEVSGDWGTWLAMLNEGAAGEAESAIRDLKQRIYAAGGIAGLERDGIHQANILNTMDMAVADLASGNTNEAYLVLERYYEQFPELIAWAAQMVGKNRDPQTFRPPVLKEAGICPTCDGRPMENGLICPRCGGSGIAGADLDGFNWKTLKEYMEQTVSPGDYVLAEDIAQDFNVMGVEPYVTERMVLVAADRLEREGLVQVVGNEIHLLPDEIRPWPGMARSGDIEPKW